MFSSRSLKGYLPATSFVMGKKAKARAQVQITRQELPTGAPQNSKLQTPGSTATTHTIATLSPSYLFLEAASTLSGPSQDLLNKMIDAMGVKRDTVRVSNLAELAPAISFGSKVVIALGDEAARVILKSDQAISNLRGKVHFLKTGERVIATFHPSYLLENTASKKDAWEDLKLAMREMSAP